MRTLDFAPLWRSSIGFDYLADLVDTTLRQPPEDNYPPCNIERFGDDRYRITLAIAGFDLPDIALTTAPNALTIEARKRDEVRDYLHQGIPTRPFRRVFNLAGDVEVTQAVFQDGLLTIDLVREVPEAMKPRRIEIGTGAATVQSARRKAA